MSTMDDWVSCRRRLIQTLRELANELDTMQTRFQRSKVAGGVASVGGGIVAGSLFIASFFTAGLTLPLAIGAGVLSGGGAAIAIGAEVGKYIHQSKILKKAQTLLEEDIKLSRKLLQSSIGKIPGIAKGGLKIAEIIVDDVVGNTAKALSLSNKAANVTKLAKASGIVGLVILPLDIAFLISDSVKLHKGSVNEASKKIQELANLKEKELEEILKQQMQQN